MINIFLTRMYFFHKRRQCDVIAASSCICLYQKAYSMNRYIYMYTCLTDKRMMGHIKRDLH